MIERYTKMFALAQNLADIDKTTFLPGTVSDSGSMSVRVKSPCFEVEDFWGTRDIFLALLDVCDKIEFAADENSDDIIMTTTVKEEY